MEVLRRELDTDIRLAARGGMSVLIAGERGAGKQYAARLVHGWSRRSQAPFVTARCTADAPFEFELFGRAEGSFSETSGDTICRLQGAEGGSLVLEEVGEISQHLQRRLLRFLEVGLLERSDHPPRAVDVRVIATATQPLLERVVAREFLEDLYYRLNVIHIRVPPLRERREEIPLVTAQILRDLAESRRSSVPQLAPATMAFLQAYNWPGNVRELRDVLESLLVSSRTALVEPGDLPPRIVRQSQHGLGPVNPSAPGNAFEALAPRETRADTSPHSGQRFADR